MCICVWRTDRDLVNAWYIFSLMNKCCMGANFFLLNGNKKKFNFLKCVTTPFYFYMFIRWNWRIFIKETMEIWGQKWQMLFSSTLSLLLAAASWSSVQKRFSPWPRHKTLIENPCLCVLEWVGEWCQMSDSVHATHLICL